MDRLDRTSADQSGCECPVDPRIERYFDRKTRQLLAAGDEATLGPVSRRLLAALLRCDPAGQTVLEGGCGRGALLIELVRAGASRATGMDLSRESVDAARRLAVEAGLGDRAEFRVGDAATESFERHDWVVLDKVICCYRYADRLLENSLSAAVSVYAFAVPTSRGLRGALARTIGLLEDVTNSLRGRPCPGYVHDVDAMERRLQEAGFRRVHGELMRLWYIAVFRRPPHAAHSLASDAHAAVG